MRALHSWSLEYPQERNVGHPLLEQLAVDVAFKLPDRHRLRALNCAHRLDPPAVLRLELAAGPEWENGQD